jgi:hypothetical protein
MKSAEVSGIVKDANGDFLQDVTITTGTATTTTNKMGLFAFSEVGTVKDRSVMKFSKSGYFTVVRSGVYADDMLMEVVMQRMEDVAGVSIFATFDATSEKTLEVGDMKVKIPAGALVTATGEVYTGTVKAGVLYLDPNNANFAAMMPGGDMMAVRADNSEAFLISYGMLEVSLTDGAGKKLQIKDGAEADLTFPIPAGMESNPPATIPLWNFNEETGLWEEEGIVTLQGSVYVGKAKHFSWKNVDSPYTRFTVKGKVTDDCHGNPIAGVRVCITDQAGVIYQPNYTTCYTNSAGEYSVFVPAGYSATLTILSQDYLNYSEVVAIPIAAQSAQTTKTQDITLSCTPIITGKVVNTCDDLIGVYVWFEYTHNGNAVKTSPIWTKSNGEFSTRIPAETNGKVWIEDLSGNVYSRNIPTSTASSNVDLGIIEICEENRPIPNTITVNFPDGTFDIPLTDSILVLEGSDGFYIQSRESIKGNRMFLTIYGYKPNVEDYNTNQFCYLENFSDICALSSQAISVNVKKKDSESYIITIAGTGTYHGELPYYYSAVTIFGIFQVFRWHPGMLW